MYRLLIFVALLSLAPTVADAQTPATQEKSPKEVVEQFYEIETHGRWLGPDHWNELED